MEKEPFDFPLQLRQGRIERFPSRIDDYGPLWAQAIEMKADGLADTPLDTVAHHGFTQGAGHGKTDAGTIRLLLANAESGEQGTGEPGTLVIDSSEILRTQQADTFRKTRDGNYLSELTVSFLRPRARRRARTARPFLVSIRERNPCVFARWRLFG